MGFYAVAAFVTVSWLIIHLVTRVSFSMWPSLRARITLKPAFLSVDWPTPNAYPHASPTYWLHGSLKAGVRGWFTAGVVVGVVVGLGATAFVLWNCVRSLAAVFSVSAAAREVAATMTPLVPGVTLPWEEAGSMFVAVAVAVVWHEAGHALAAVVEGVHVRSVGLLLIGVVPGAYVHMGTDLDARPPVPRLRVIYAGVWHNVVLVLGCVAALMSAPMWLSPAFRVGDGVAIGRIPPGSAFGDALAVGDVITHVNHVQVGSTAEWQAALEALMPGDGDNPRQFGLCGVSGGLPPTPDLDGGCCGRQAGPRHLCFLLGLTGDGGFSCADAKQVALDSTAACDSTSPDCPPGTTCVRPQSPDAGMRLFALRLRNGTTAAFAGTPGHLYAAFTPTDWSLRPGMRVTQHALSGVLSRPVLRWVDGIPVAATAFLRLLILVSSSMAVFNAAPVWFTDGDHATRVAIVWLQHRLHASFPGFRLPMHTAATVLKVCSTMFAMNVVMAGVGMLL